MMHKRSLWFAALLVLSTMLILPSTGWSKKRRAPPDAVEDALAYATTDRQKAIRVLEDAIAAGPSGRDLPVLLVHAGEQRRLAGDLQIAHEWFTKTRNRARKNGSEREAAALGMVLIAAADGMEPQALNALRDVSEKDALATMNADRYLHMAVAAARRDDASRLTAFSRRARTHAMDDPEVLRRVEDTLAVLAEATPEEMEIVAEEGGNSKPWERAVAAYAAGDLELARKWANRVSPRADDEPPATATAMPIDAGSDVDSALGMLRTIDGARPRTDLVVALIPLTGKYEAVGSQVRDALQFGWGQGGAALRFVDSGATPETAVAAFERAVLVDGAIAVIGPLLSDETDAVTQAAERLHVPLISLSQGYEADGYWTLQAMYTRTDQVAALLEHAMGAGGMTSFAMFHPDNSFGTDAARAFTKEVAKRGGTISTQAAYSAEDKNLLPFAKELGVREGDLQRLRYRARAQGGNPDTVVVPPVIDFQGIFMPETAGRTPLAAAALAYEEFPMGDFVPTRASPVVQLLGLSTWNTPGLVTQGNEYTRNSLFPDVFSATTAGREDPFVLAYKEATGRTPSALEAATVDAGRLVGAALSARPGHRAAFRDALLQVDLADAVTGARRFDPETLRATRTMKILTITDTTIEEVAEVTL